MNWEYILLINAEFKIEPEIGIDNGKPYYLKTLRLIYYYGRSCLRFTVQHPKQNTTKPMGKKNWKIIVIISLFNNLNRLRKIALKCLKNLKSLDVSDIFN